MEARPARRLEAAALTARAGGREVLSAVTFDVAVGEIVAIVGPNGAGKTTLLECIAGLRPATGSVRFDDHALRTWSDRASIMTYMPDELVLPPEIGVGLALGIDVRSAFAAARDRRPARRARQRAVARRAEALPAVRGAGSRCRLARGRSTRAASSQRSHGWARSSGHRSAAGSCRSSTAWSRRRS